jgi:(p)ppGpp synthase/HD superfamily hydrolase
VLTFEQPAGRALDRHPRATSRTDVADNRIQRGAALSTPTSIDRSGPGPEAATNFPAPGWIADSALLAKAHALAAEAHGDQRRATDRALFLEHVVEVGALLHEAGFDDDLVAAGLLHDAVERGTLGSDRLRDEMDDEISSLVLALTEDATISSFPERKEALRDQVRTAGPRAITIFAADKLSDIRGLRRGIDRHRDSIEARMGTTVDGMAAHYRESVDMIEAHEPRLAFTAELRVELEWLAGPAVTAGAA